MMKRHHLLAVAIALVEATLSAAKNSKTCKHLKFTSCEECMDAGCNWCPIAGLCYGDGYEHKVKEGGCRVASEWIVPEESSCPSNYFDDPLLDAQQWVYDALNLQKVWEMGLTGEGIRIQVVDDGVDVEHAEFADKFDRKGSCDVYLPPDPESDTHGTTCASIALANADNGVCASGVAPDATLQACSFQNTPQAFRKAVDHADISSNSWNMDACSFMYQDERRLRASEPCPTKVYKGSEELNIDSDECGELLQEYCGGSYEADADFCEEHLAFYVDCEYNELTRSETRQLSKAVTEGRNGLGVIFTFAAGNEYGIGETINMEGYLNSRYTIAVAAIDQGQVKASYSTTGGSALFISGPGGDHEYFTNHISAKVGGGCINAGVGTSFATPAVSGAIALVLQANPKLGWRDVQGVLAKTAQKVEADSNLWTKNAAGFSHHPFYGFGVMDAYAAVKAAQDWDYFGEERKLIRQDDDINVPIADDPNDPAIATIVLPDEGIVAEHVLVTLHVEHPTRGNLQVLLESPQGTESELVPSHRREVDNDDDSWHLMSVVQWGENPAGEWTVTLVDRVEGHMSEDEWNEGDAMLVSWKIIVYGHDSDGEEVDDEEEESDLDDDDIFIRG